MRVCVCVCHRGERALMRACVCVYGACVFCVCAHVGGCRVQAYTFYTHVRTLLRAEPAAGNYRRLGLMGDDFTTWRHDAAYPIDDPRRPFFGPLFWILAWPLLFQLTHFKQHAMVKGIHA